MSARIEQRIAQSEDHSAFLDFGDSGLSDDIDDMQFSGHQLQSTEDHPLRDAFYGYEEISDSPAFSSGPSYFDQDPEEQEGLGGAVSHMKDDDEWQTIFDFGTPVSAPHLGRMRFARTKPIKSFYEMEHTDGDVRAWYCESLAHLPMQILIQILGHLDTADLVRVSRTCHRLYEIACRDIFWQPIYEDEFRAVTYDFRDSHCSGYRDLYVDTISRMRSDSPGNAASSFTFPSEQQHVNDHTQEWTDDEEVDPALFTETEDLIPDASFSKSAAASSSSSVADESAGSYDTKKGEYESFDIPLEVLSGNSAIASALIARPMNSSDEEDMW